MSTKLEKNLAKEGLLHFDFFDIDINRLDVEWINQPKLFFKYASELADGRRRFEGVKAELDVTRAEVDTTIRENPAKYDLEKTTETLIANTVIQQPRYQKALKTFRIKKHRVDILQAAVTALEHRKSALERLVSLHGQNYFATPKATDDVSKETVDDIKNLGRKHRRQEGKQRKGKKVKK